MRVYEFNGLPVTAAEYGSLMADLFAAGWTIAPPCPTCSWPSRETVGMVCQTCGKDYARLPAPAEPEGRGDE